MIRVLLKKLIKEYIPFEKDRIAAYPNMPDSQIYSDGLLDMIVDSPFKSILIESEPVNQQSYGFTLAFDQKGESVSIYWSVDNIDFVSDELISLLIYREGFVCGTIFDLLYTMKESETNLQSYLQLGGKYDKSKLVQDPRTEMYSIDVKENYGRRKYIGSYILIAAPRMWYGIKMIDLIGREKILDFIGADSIMELDNEIIFIELYNPLQDSASVENRMKQKKFREQVEMDRLESIEKNNI